MKNRKLRKQLIKAIPVLFLIGFLFACVKANAAEEITPEEAEGIVQEILNESSGVAVNLNSQIMEDGKAKKQGIKNVRSWCNININRNTFKFYYINPSEK